MSISGGRIIVEQAYAQGKMLGSQNWSGRLARGITPSDIDFVIESNGAFLWAEFSRDSCTTDGLLKGQQLLYERLAKRPGLDVVTVCRHCVPWEQQIDTMFDVYEATAYFACGTKAVKLTNSRWQELVVAFANNAAAANSTLDRWLRDDDFVRQFGV